MIEVTTNPNGSLYVSLGPPERIVISEVAVGFSIPKEEAMVAIMYRGMDSLSKQLKAEAAKHTAKRDTDSNGVNGEACKEAYRQGMSDGLREQDKSGG